jgi:hypothetical protein
MAFLSADQPYRHTDIITKCSCDSLNLYCSLNTVKEKDKLGETCNMQEKNKKHIILVLLKRSMHM